MYASSWDKNNIKLIFIYRLWEDSFQQLNESLEISFAYDQSFTLSWKKKQKKKRNVFLIFINGCKLQNLPFGVVDAIVSVPESGSRDSLLGFRPGADAAFEC